MLSPRFISIFRLFSYARHFHHPPNSRPLCFWWSLSEGIFALFFSLLSFVWSIFPHFSTSHDEMTTMMTRITPGTINAVEQGGGRGREGQNYKNTLKLASSKVDEERKFFHLSFVITLMDIKVNGEHDEWDSWVVTPIFFVSETRKSELSWNNCELPHVSAVERERNWRKSIVRSARVEWEKRQDMSWKLQCVCVWMK